MNIKNKLKEAGILIGVFIVAVLVFSYFTNKGNDNMTADIGTATFPKIGFDCGWVWDKCCSRICAVMDIPTIRDTITPVLSGKLNVEINAYEKCNFKYGIQGVFVRWHRSVSGEEDKKPGENGNAGS